MMASPITARHRTAPPCDSPLAPPIERLPKAHHGEGVRSAFAVVGHLSYMSRQGLALMRRLSRRGGILALQTFDTPGAPRLLGLLATAGRSETVSRSVAQSAGWRPLPPDVLGPAVRSIRQQWQDSAPLHQAERAEAWAFDRTSGRWVSARGRPVAATSVARSCAMPTGIGFRVQFEPEPTRG